jgi:hypothetical protein
MGAATYLAHGNDQVVAALQHQFVELHRVLVAVLAISDFLDELLGYSSDRLDVVAPVVDAEQLGWYAGKHFIALGQRYRVLQR